ncbi:MULTISPECIES: helix-turn-helix transcriptional regulator [unclassified Exiguobacterium]|uniref:helix-turn-helix domain-containing protein n=1 Tax=unclassified Exiguobacterium TaxID=2644629 RepID=UPI001BEAFF3F
MSIGKVIYYHRKKQRKTQEQLCQGICSTTHLSKIENNTKEVNEKTLALLCDRLGISIEEENRKTEALNRKLTQFYEAMERLHRDHAARLKKELEEYKDFLQCTEMVYLFELYMLRYLLFTNQSSLFEDMVKRLKQNYNKYSSFEKYLWNFFQAIHRAQRLQFSEALTLLNQIEKEAERYSGKVTDYYYYKAAVHGQLKQFTLSLHYSHRALQTFQSSGNISRILHVKIGLSANLIYINDLESAEHLLQTALHDAEMLNDHATRPIALHNYGLWHYKKGNLEEALQYFTQSLQSKQLDTSSYYGTLTEMIKVQLDLGERESALALLKDVLRDFKGEQSGQYVELMVLYLEMNGDTKRLKEYLIEYGIPLMQQEDLHKTVSYAERLATILQQQGDYVQANDYLCLANSLLKNLLFNHSNT